MATISVWDPDAAEQLLEDLCNWDALPDDALAEAEEQRQQQEQRQRRQRQQAGGGADPRPEPLPPAARPATRAERLAAFKRHLIETLPLGYVVHRQLLRDGKRPRDAMMPDTAAAADTPAPVWPPPPPPGAGGTAAAAAAGPSGLALPAVLQPAAVAVGGAVLMCGGLLPSAPRHMPRAINAPIDGGLRGWEPPQEDASRAYAVAPPRPSASLGLLLGTSRGFASAGTAGMPRGAGSCLHSAAAQPAEWRGRGEGPECARRVLLFGGEVTAGAAPSARDLLERPEAAREDAAHGLTNALRVLHVSPCGAEVVREEWLGADEQGGDVPCPRALHSAAFGQPSASVGPGPDGDDACLLLSLRRFREAAVASARALPAQLERGGGGGSGPGGLPPCPTGRTRAPMDDRRMRLDPSHDRALHEAASQTELPVPPTAVRAADVRADATPLELCLAYEISVCGSAGHECAPDSMYVYGGVRYAGGAGGGAPRRRVPADSEAGRVYELEANGDRHCLDKVPPWLAHSTSAAPGQPPSAVPNTTTLLAFWAAAGGAALYAVPDRISGGGSGGGGGGGYRIHRLCLRELTWRFVPVGVSTGGGGGGGPEARPGCAAVHLPPGWDEARYSGGRLVVYGGSGGGGAGGGADVHVLHLPPDGALAGETMLARAAYLATLEGALPPRTAAGRMAERRLLERRRRAASAAGDGGGDGGSAAWWEAVSPEAFPAPSAEAPPGSEAARSSAARAPAEAAAAAAATTAAAAAAAATSAAAPLLDSPSVRAMLPLLQHAGAALGGGAEGPLDPDSGRLRARPSGLAGAAVFVGGCEVGGGPPSRAVQALRLSVARPPGAPPGGGAAQRAAQHWRRQVAGLMLRARRRRLARRAAGGGGLPARQVELRVAGAPADAPGYALDPELLSLYSSCLFDEQLQALLPGSEDEGGGGGGGGGAPTGGSRARACLPLPVPSQGALLDVLCWAQGRLAVWAIRLPELFDLFIAADALAMPALMDEALRELRGAVSAGRSDGPALVAHAAGRHAPPDLEAVVGEAARRCPWVAWGKK